jgi:hypothetical protein
MLCLATTQTPARHSLGSPHLIWINAPGPIWRQELLYGEDSMLTSSHSTQAGHGSVLGAMVQGWWRVIAIGAAKLLKLARSGARSVGHLKSGLGSRLPESSQPLARAPNDATLLARRMAALDLDAYELAITEAALVHHLKRRCLSCEAWRRCLQDLTPDRADLDWQECQDWMDYCPNASALEMLSALQSRIKIAPRYSFPYLG